MRKTLLATLASAALTVAFAPAALAQGISWSVSSTFGASYGDFYNQSGTSARTNAYYRDKVPGGAPVYEDTAYYMYGPNDTGSYVWTYWGSRQTGRTASSSWSYGSHQVSLWAYGDRARGVHSVCRDESWKPDVCNDYPAYTTFSY